MKKLLIIVVAAALGTGVYFMTRDRDEARIRKRLDRLAHAMCKQSEPAGGMPLLKKIGVIRSLFIEECTVRVGPPVGTINGIERLATLFSHAMKTPHELTVTFHDITITIGASRTAAASTMTAKAESRDLIEGGGIDVREIEMQWRMREGKWKIAAVTEVSTLR